MTAIPQGRTRRTVVVGAMCALVVTGTGLTGCSEDPDAGTNGVGKLPAEQIQSKTRAAAESADALRLSGNVVTSGRTYKLDMRLKSDGGSGSVTAEGATFHLLRIGEELYLKADAGFWTQADGKGGESDAAADKLDGKYVKVPSGDPAYKKFSGFTDKDVLLDGLLTLHGSLDTDGHHEQAGTRTIRITGDKGDGGTLDVSLEGQPYPLRLARAGGAGTLTFSAWGKDFPLAEPGKDETVDYGKQLPTS
ncbi:MULTISPECIES: hypothetical protein [unclassified Streptomyces]|uniref:hypothetical protein n=1 Tax=unclassified Streptomyces TaxID=2593676 RepID=UPI000F50CD31|nr:MULTISPECIES: hypothetical protein [unclassified Streptomyces]MDH6452700.1 hypothetical protein [Streptomyces sp. SAI-119]MDH6496745.1 hypothetical protein [Streptomyces sp. SAI-149]QUC56490.1 hypothetical protein IOD14_06625 [Streptomyces sp. A2-16]